MRLAKEILHVVAERHVFTYQPNGGWPAALLTGYVNQAGGFVLEHMVAFPGAPPGTLQGLLETCLREGWNREYVYVLIEIPASHPRHRGLTALARRFGFKEEVTGKWVKHRT